MKRNLVIVLIGLLSVALISGCGGTSTTTPTGNAVSVPKQEEKVYSVGDTVNVDSLSYRIDKIETYSTVGTSMFGKETQGLFYKVYLTITNNAKETTTIFSPRLKLIDDQGRQYDEAVEANMYINDAITFGVQLQPGLTVSGAVMFELPQDSKGLKLEIRGDWISTSKITINIADNEIVYKGQETSVQDGIDDQMADAQKQMEDLMSQLD